jgi:hypothetical protein
MVNAKQIKQLAERLAKAEALVAAGAVFPVAGLSGYGVVRNGDGSQMYLVCYDAGKEHCTCKEFEHRQGKVNAPCKHILAAQIGAASDAPSRPPNLSASGRSCRSGRTKTRPMPARHWIARPSAT